MLEFKILPLKRRLKDLEKDWRVTERQFVAEAKKVITQSEHYVKQNQRLDDKFVLTFDLDS